MNQDRPMKVDLKAHGITEERKRELLNGSMLLKVLDYVLEEQLARRRPNDLTVAEHFGLTLEEVVLIHDHLEEIGEFD